MPLDLHLYLRAVGPDAVARRKDTSLRELRLFDVRKRRLQQLVAV